MRASHCLLLAGALQGCGAFSAVGAAVNTLEDQLDVPAGPELSLREALRDAASEEVVTFDPALAGGTIDLAGSELEVDSNVTIDASGLGAGGMTISANRKSRVITVAVGVEAVFKNLTVTGGASLADSEPGLAGAGINNKGWLLLERCVVTDNITSDRGGGVFHHGPELILKNCTIDDCEADEGGGGVYARSGSVVLESTTVSRNKGRDGAGIYVEDVELSIVNSTIAANEGSDGAALFSSQSELSLVHCTVSGNLGEESGGLTLRETNLFLEGCVIAGNHSREHVEIRRVDESTVTASGPSVIGSNGTVEDVFPAGALVGTPAAPLDPLLSPLGDFGGAAKTLMPLSGSPLLDAAPPTPFTPPSDQRGEPRPVGLALDLGAVEVDAALPVTFPQDGAKGVSVDVGLLAWGVERQADNYDLYLGTEPVELRLLGSSEVGRFPLDDLEPDTTYYWRIDHYDSRDRTMGRVRSFSTRVPLVVDTSQDVVDSSDGRLSLREAITIANAIAGFDRIECDSALNGATILLRHGEYLIDSSLHLDASSLPDGLTLSGGGTTRVFRAKPRHEVLIKGVVIRDGFTGPPSDPMSFDPFMRGYGGAINSLAELTLEDVVLRDNTSEGVGGAVSAEASLVMRNCVLLDNQATMNGGAMALGGRCELIDSSFIGNVAGSGGALSLGKDTTDSAVLVRCTVTDNSCEEDGGGILHNTGELVVTDTVIARNSAQECGGGVASEKSLILRNTTVSENRAENHGGGLYGAGDMSLVNVTVTRNTGGSGGGLHLQNPGGSLDLQESIVAGNISNAGPADVGLVEGAALTVEGRNLIGSNESVEDRFPAGPLVGTTAAPLDPWLSELGDHGGPTATCVPLAGSPAIDAGDPAASGSLETDQRGRPRPLGSAPDVGAVELADEETRVRPEDGATLVSPHLASVVWTLQSGATAYEVFFGTDPATLSSLGVTEAGSRILPDLAYGTTYHWRVDAVGESAAVAGPLRTFTTRPDHLVTTGEDVVDEADGLWSLREAIDAANSLGGANLIRFESALAGQTIVLTHGALPIEASVTIDAASLDESLTISGGGSSRIFEVESGHDVWLRGLILTGGKAPPGIDREAGGGAIFSDARSLRLTACTVTGNEASAAGGGIYDTSNLLTVEDTRFFNNTSNGEGGGLFTGADIVAIANGQFVENTARKTGGGAFLEEGTCTISDSSFTGNYAGSGGAGLHSASRGSVGNCEFLDNTGAGACFTRSPVIEDSRFIGNTGAGLSGGYRVTAKRLVVERNLGRGISATSLRLSDSRVAHNSSPEKGGGIWCGNASIITACTIAHNSSGEEGGGIAAAEELYLDGCSIARNYATLEGGGVWTGWSYSAVLVNCTVAGNGARKGGGIYHYRESLLDLRSCTVTGNLGGGMYLDGGSLLLENTVVAANIGPSEGPDIRLDGNLPVTVLGSALIGNHAGVASQLPAGALVGTPAAPLDPGLAPLGDYGDGLPIGLPLPGSPVIDAGVAIVNLPATDQRGAPREIGGAPDLGAIESDSSFAFHVPGDGAEEVSLSPTLAWPAVPGAVLYHLYLGTAPDALTLATSSETSAAQLFGLAMGTRYYWRVDSEGSASTTGQVSSFTTADPLVVTSNGDGVVRGDGFTTLREALFELHTRPGGGSIRFVPSLDGARINIYSPLVLHSDVEIDATALPAGVTVAAGPPNPDHRHFVVTAGATATFRGFALIYGKEIGGTWHSGSEPPGDRGGSIYSLGDLNLSDMTFEANYANTAGAAVYAGSGTNNTISRCTFRANRAESIVELAPDAVMAIRDSTFTKNEGGSSVANRGEIVVEGCLFVGNRSVARGAGFHQHDGSALVRNCTFTNNYSERSGGAVGLQDAGAPLRIDHCTIVDNESQGRNPGGGIYIQRGALTLTNSIVARNVWRSMRADIGSVNSDDADIDHGVNFIGNNRGVEDVFPPGPLVGTPFAPLDPLLAPLGDYGGITETMPLHPASPAIDAGRAGTARDQRGAPRPAAFGPDLGSFEFGDEIFLFPQRATQAEGHFGITPVVFTVARPPGSLTALQLDVTLAGGGAVVPGVVAFPAGLSTATIVAELTGAAVNADRVVALTISNPPAGLAISRESAATVVTNDDAAPLLVSVNHVDGEVRLDWASRPGRRYTIRYSDDLETWRIATQALLAEGARSTWVDHGPPHTAIHPTRATARYYQVTEDP